MSQETILIGLAGVLASAAPVVFAVLGETISERAGVINLFDRNPPRAAAR